MKLLYKKIGETPLECMNRNYGECLRPLSYAGRLDPMAEGLVLILEGDECRDREKFLSMDKKYIYEGIVGVSTDSLDLLGRIKKISDVDVDVNIKSSIESLRGRISMFYPMFSSKIIAGKSLFELVRSGKSVKTPMNKINILKHKYISHEFVKGKDIALRAINNVSLVKGDFRQKDILKDWEDFLRNNGEDTFIKFRAEIHSTSGTYVRSIVEEIGKKIKKPTVTFSIVRTGVGEWEL